MQCTPYHEGFNARVTAYIERTQSRREAPWTRSARLPESAFDQEWFGLWCAEMEVQGLPPKNQFQAAARRAAVEERNRCAVIHAGPVDECHRQATRRFDPVDPDLDSSSCRNARAAPSTRARRERGCDGTGRTLAFPSKKRTSCGSGWLLIALANASSTGNVAIVMPPR